MSDIFVEEEKEKIIFDNFDKIDISDLESEENETGCIFNINNNQKINSFKISTDNKSKESKVSEKSIEKKEQIDKIKFNLFLAITSKCKPAKIEYEDILKERYLRAKRLVIQDIEISGGIINYGPKKYVFIPLKIGNDIIKIETNNNKSVMKLNEKPLIGEIEFNEICLKQNVKTKDNDSSKISEILSNKSSSKNDSLASSKTKKSKKDNSSEKGGTLGIQYYEKKEESKFIKYTYYADFEKEVDGVYCKHKELKIKEGSIPLNFEDLLNDLNKNYNNDNSLNAHIIMKNFKKLYIPED